MPNDITTRGYQLPHPDNIAASDVMRIRKTLEVINADIQTIDDLEITRNLEAFINLWRIAS